MSHPNPPSTPPPRAPPFTGSTPIKKMDKFFAEHKRDEVQAFVYDQGIHNEKIIKNQKTLGFLALPHRTVPSKVPDDMDPFTFTNFVSAANILAIKIRNKHFPKRSLLVFKSTGSKIQRGHVTDTRCMPDITAAFEDHWKNDNTTLWPCIRLAGEQASEGKSRTMQKMQAISYLHYLLLARPDLHVAQGLLTSKSGIIFLFGVGGVGIQSFPVAWECKSLYKLMYAFVYRLYEPGHFADSSYVKMTPVLAENLVKYTVNITVTVKIAVGGVEEERKQTIECPNFYPIYACNPFGTRTHVLSNPLSQAKVNGQVLTVLKDQLCRRGTRFDEYSILSHIHEAGKVPGVVEAVHHELIKVPEFLDNSREKRRLGLRQSGSPFTSIRTLRHMLETTFDVLEVLRYLRIERRILHRDISKGNVLCVSEPNVASVRAPNTQVKEPLAFIKYLLGESNDPQETSALLIDFNRGEHLDSHQGPEFDRVDRTGTPLFIAQAVEMGNAVPLSQEVSLVPAVPNSPEPYTLNHPDRIKKFPSGSRKIIEEASADSHGRQWRHELGHDAESVFWLFFYWALGVQPTKSKDEPVDLATWANLTGTAKHRTSLIRSLAVEVLPGTTHSFYRPLWPLITDFASILVVDRHWLEDSNIRNEPEYINEAFQRLILRFILDHRDEEFMTGKVIERHFRPVEVIPQHLSLPTTDSQIRNEADNRKRPSPQPSIEGDTKRRRLDCTSDEGEDDPHGDKNEGWLGDFDDDLDEEYDNEM